jgi:predicted AlkP superfamily pyrophosphatase or phosphodiesterase
MKAKMFLLISLILAGGTIPAKLLAQDADTTQQIAQDRYNTPEEENQPYIILISADGFRHDLADKYKATHLLGFRSKGVYCDFMLASYPSLTFPNHYTLVTGLYPAHHGLVDNHFYDPKRGATYSMSAKFDVGDSSWYGGTPIWTLAEQHHMLTASFYWVGSEAPIGGYTPTYWYHYNTAIPIDDRIQIVKNWLQLRPDKRPHLITFYMPEVDHAEHLYGPDAPQTKEAVQFVDESVAKLASSIDSLGLNVNYIFVSDHGMTTVDTVHTLSLPAAVDSTKFIIPAGEALLHLYAKNKADIRPTYEKLKAGAKDYDVYLSEDIPAHWHYSKKDDRYGRIGDILLVPHLPKVFSIEGRPVHVGEHGFDNFLPDMHAIFIAWGPAFLPGTRLRNFENVDIYPLLAKLLDLPITERIDGHVGILKDGLQP